MAENQRLGLDSLETIGRTVGEGGSAEGAVNLEDAQTAVRKLQGQDTDEVAGVSNEVAGASRRVDDDLPPMRYDIGTDADGNRVLVEDPQGPYRMESDGNGDFRAVPAEGADSDTLQSLSVRRGSDGQFRPVDPDASNTELLRPGGAGLEGYDQTYEDLSSSRPLGSIQRDGENSPLVLDTVTETGAPLYRLNDSSGEDGRISPHAWRETPAPTESPIPREQDGRLLLLPPELSDADVGHRLSDPIESIHDLDAADLDARYKLEVTAGGTYRFVKDPNCPYMFEAGPYGGVWAVADPNAPVKAPLDLRGYRVAKGQDGHFQLAEHASNPWRKITEINPDARYDLDFDERRLMMLVEIDPEVVEGGDYVLRKDASGEVRVVRNLDPNWQFTAPKDIWDFALRVGNDGKIRLFERFSLVADGRGRFEMVSDPYGPYMLQLDSMGERRLVMDPEAPGADPLLDLDRFSIRDRGGGFLLFPLGASDPDVVRRRPDDPGEVIYNTVTDPTAAPAQHLEPLYQNTPSPAAPAQHLEPLYQNTPSPAAPAQHLEPLYQNTPSPAAPAQHLEPLYQNTPSPAAPAQHLEPLYQNTPFQAALPDGPPSHSPPDLDVTAVLNGVEDASRTADNLGAVEPPPVRTPDDTGASAGARLDEQGARWEMPANPVEFSNEGHPGAGGSARLAEPEANSHFHGAVGPDPRTRPLPPLPEDVVGSGSPSGLPEDFDIEHAITRLEEQITLRNDMIGRAKLQDAKLQGAKLQGIKGDDLRRLEAERDACKLVVAELRADRDPRPALRAQATSTQEPFRAQAFSALHASLDNRSAFFYPQAPEVSRGLHADVLAVLDGKVPPSVDTSDLVARWREMAQNMLAFRADQTDPDVIRRGELYGEVEMAIRGAFKRVMQGRDPTGYLQQRIVALETRTLADGTTEANMLRGMVQQYRTLLEGSIDGLHLSPEWLAAVSNLRAAERGGDLGASDEAWKWLNLLTSLDGKGADKLSADDFADGTLIQKVYADDLAILDGRLPPRWTRATWSNSGQTTPTSWPWEICNRGSRSTRRGPRSSSTYGKRRR